jgi:hypothetical protein
LRLSTFCRLERVNVAPLSAVVKRASREINGIDGDGPVSVNDKKT